MSQARTARRDEVRPIIHIVKSLVCLQLRDEVKVKSLNTFRVHAPALEHRMRFISRKLSQILKLELAYHASKFSGDGYEP